jgi:Na+-transporting NADH:ubiquinone oxidoreductase subunit NqrE
MQLARVRRRALTSRFKESGLPEIAAESNDLKAIRRAVEDAAAVSGGLWLSYLFVLFYIAVAAGAVTHVDLLLESPVKLPFLGIDLPLKAFFFLAPILFLITHAYTLVHFVLLASFPARSFCRDLISMKL